MKKILQFGAFWLFSVVFFLAGCATASRPPVRVQVTIPTCQGSYQAIVAGSKKPPTGRMISVKVGGEVNRPGSYALPENATILDAIALAGGPTIYAFMSRIYVDTKDGRNWVFKLQKIKRPYEPPIVWYGKWSPMEDQVLEDGAIVWVKTSWC